MDALLQLLATLAAAGLLTDEQASDLTARLEAVEPIPADQIEGVSTSDDADRTAAENAGIAALGNADPTLLADVRTVLVAVAQNDDVSTAQVIEIANHVEGIQYVEAVGSEIAQYEQEQRDAAIARITPVASDAEPDPDAPDGDEGGEPAPDAPVGSDDPADAEPALEPVLASAAVRTRPRAGDIGRANRANANRQPTPADRETAGRQYRTLSNMGGRSMGEVVNEADFVAAMAEAMNDLGANTTGDDKFERLGRIVTEYPEDRRLGRDPLENGRVIDDRLSAFDTEIADSGSYAAAVANVLTASGGICAPVEPHYDYPLVGDDQRVVGDFLPTWDASRGGVSSRIPATLGSLGAVNTTASGITNWTAANDLSPSDPATKVVYTATCPSLTTTQIYAIVARLRHGNFMGLYDPETVAMWVHLQMVLQARIADTAMLTTINTNSKQIIETAIRYGFARDFLNNVSRLATAERRRNRMPRHAVVDMLAPDWVLDALRDDRTLEIPGSIHDPFSMPDAEIGAWFSDRGIRPGWFRDSQEFAAQGGVVGGQQGELVKYNTRVKVFLYATGYFVRLDGGRLDLGVERSNTLNDTNDTQTMSEVMEAVHPRGGAFADALEMPVCVSGAVAGTNSPVCTS